MLKPLHLLAAVLCATISSSQKTDTLILFYKPDQYSISKLDKLKLDSFLLRSWDRFAVNGYTDETEGEEYNMELSKKRSGEVYEYLVSKNINTNIISTQYYGESKPQADNNTGDGRALNRRTMIIGYQFLKLTNIKPKEDPMKPVTKTLDNGFIVTYKPAGIPSDMADNFASGWGLDIQLVRNPAEMRQNNLFNNTTNGEILSSVMIFRSRRNPCKLDSPILVKVPVPGNIKCPISKIKFFSAVAEKGKMIWQEQTKMLYPEMIDGQQYLSVWMDDFCSFTNFDIKVDPDCYDLDSTRIFYVNANIRNLSAELIGLNSVYIPRQINKNTHSLLYEKNKLASAPVSFVLYDGKRRVKSFRSRSLDLFPYDSINKRYLLSTASYKFHFPGVKVFDMVLKVNGDKYRVFPEKRKCDVLYLNRKNESILVDFSTIDGRGRYTIYRDQPLASLRFDAGSGYYIIDKNFIRELKEKEKAAMALK